MKIEDIKVKVGKIYVDAKKQVFESTAEAVTTLGEETALARINYAEMLAARAKASAPFRPKVLPTEDKALESAAKRIITLAAVEGKTLTIEQALEIAKSLKGMF